VNNEGELKHMSNIKITVEYETPQTDKFAELMKQYEEIKTTSAETVSYYKPLADASEEKKLELILEQLETIKSYMMQIYSITNRAVNIKVIAYAKPIDRAFIMQYNEGKYIVRWDSFYDFNIGLYRQCKNRFNAERNESFNILGNWEKWRIYERLEQRCLDLLKEQIDKKKQEAENEVNRLKNITER
jgi:hypothetical protein